MVSVPAYRQDLVAWQPTPETKRASGNPAMAFCEQLLSARITQGLPETKRESGKPAMTFCEQLLSARIT